MTCKKECKCTGSCAPDNAITLDDYIKEVIGTICDYVKDPEEKKALEAISPKLIAEIGWLSISRLFVKRNVKIVPSCLDVE